MSTMLAHSLMTTADTKGVVAEATPHSTTNLEKWAAGAEDAGEAAVAAEEGAADEAAEGAGGVAVVA